MKTFLKNLCPLYIGCLLLSYPDLRQYTDPDLAKKCRSIRIWIHNTGNKGDR